MIATQRAHDAFAASAPKDDAPPEPFPPTSRIFITGLPPKFTSDQLAVHFGTRYKVTDAHVVADRRIGFVGFQDAESAVGAKKFFDKSYIRMSKIGVDLARPVDFNGSGTTAQSGKKRRGSGEDVASAGIKRKRGLGDDGEKERAQETGTEQVTDEQAEVIETQDEQPAIDASKDDDWLRGKTSRTLDLQGPDEEEPVQIHQDDDQQPTQTEVEGAEEAASDPGSGKKRVPVPNARLFLRNLAFSVTEDALKAQFSKFGKLQEAHLVKEKRNSTSKGTAFLQFAEAEQAEAALTALDGSTFQGMTDFDISKLPLKKQKALKRKQDATKASFSWNSLYMNPDAVVSSIADRLGVSKSDILDPTSADAAIKQAHAETQLIKETKDYLVSAGVNVDAFKTHARDDRIILLKNFPYGTTESELRVMLDREETLLSRFILPPSGTMAIAQFNHPADATKALKSLAYKNVKGSILYLERGPAGMLDEKKAEEVQKPVEETTTDTKSSVGPSWTVFVRNLNFATTSSRLTEIANTLPGFIKAQVKTRVDAKRPGQTLSMGYGFVEFKSRSQAESGAAALNGHRLDAHELTAQLSTRNQDAAEETRKQDSKRKSEAQHTKIIIKNLPFQASKKDIRSLFAQYGQLKMVRVPRKFDNSSRGFAFAEFVTPKEAESAMEALSNTHLLGRRLVLDFAAEEADDPEEEIKAIERKVEQQSNRVHMNQLAAGSARKKFNVDNGKEDDME